MSDNTPWFVYASLCISVIGIFVLFISCIVAIAKCILSRQSLRTPDGVSLNELSTFEALQRRPAYRVFATVEALENVTIEGPISPTSRPQEAGLRERLDMVRTYNMDTRIIPVRKSFRRQQAIVVEMEKEEEMSIADPVKNIEEERRPIRKATRRRAIMSIEIPQYLKNEYPAEVAKEDEVPNENQPRARKTAVRAMRRATMTIGNLETLTPEIPMDDVRQDENAPIQEAVSILTEEVVDQSSSIAEKDKDEPIPYPSYVRPVTGGGIQIQGYPFVFKQIKKRVA